MLKRLLKMTPLVAAIAIGVTWAPAPLVPQAAAAAQNTGDDDTDTIRIDELVLSSGQTVRGRILEETETQIIFELHLGSMKTQTRYNKSEVVRIERGVEERSVADETYDVPSRGDAGGSSDADDSPYRNNDDPDAAQIYFIDLRGTFGYNVSETPLRRVIDDINATFDDAVPNPEPGGVPTVVDPEVRSKHIVIVHIQTEPSRNGFEDIFAATSLLPLLETEIHQRGRRVVFIVNQALDGAAFMPWISPEIYFRTGGRMGFTSDLDEFETGDSMVDEKLIGARLGHAEGFAVLGGYPQLGPPIIKAMARSKYWLSVLWTGDKPLLSHRPPNQLPSSQDWELLSDDGIGPNEDDELKAVRDPNDQLVVTAKRAFRLGISKGTVKDEVELLFLLGVHRNANFVEHKGYEVFNDWNAAIERFNTQAHPGSRQIRRGELWREYDRIEVNGNFNERRKARGRQLNLLKRIRSIIKAVEEVIDPSGQLIADIELQIYIIQTQQQIDNENR